MYDKIAEVMNRDYGSSDMSSEDVENYLRHGEQGYLSDEELDAIDFLLDKFL